MKIEKLTIKSSKRLTQSQDIARKMKNSEIWAVHLLFAMLVSDDSIIQKYLEDLQIDINNFLFDVKELLYSISTVEGDYHMIISNELNFILVESEKEADKNKDNFITEEHIILSFSQKSDSLRSLFLKNNITYNKLYTCMEKYRNWEKIISNDSEIRTKLLDKYTNNLYELAKKWKIDPVIWREEEIRRTIQVLCRRTKNNPVLIWDPGVWKTAIVEGIAMKILQWEVPDNMKNKRIYTLDLWSVLAGSKFRWEFEERLQNIIKEVEWSNGKIILFIDEIHTIVWAGATEWWADAWNLLKPSLARWNLKLIWATTIAEYRKYIEKDSALERRLAPIYIDEPNYQETLTILRGIKDKYELHHGITITDSALEKSVQFSMQYISDRKLPDKAIDLIDEALSSVKLKSISKPVELDVIDKQIRSLEIEYEAKKSEKLSKDILKQLLKQIESKKEESKIIEINWKKEKEKINSIHVSKEKIEEFKIDAQNHEREWNLQEVARIRYVLIPEQERIIIDSQKTLDDISKNQKRYMKEHVDDEDIAEVISHWVWIPIQKLLVTEKEKLLNMEGYLEKKVIWQHRAVTSVSNAIRRARSGFLDNTKPIGNFLFLGPTGVGKTKMAQAISETMFADRNAYIRIDMSEYMERHSIHRLIGSPPGYIWHDEWGQLTEAVRRKPYSVILFDEIEKAHKDVINILFQLLDDGRLTDWKWRTVCFNNTIIILTSNIGSQKVKSMTHSWKDEIDIMNALEWELLMFFPIEFVNRLDDIIYFSPLDEKMLTGIVDLLLIEFSKNIEKKEIFFEFTDTFKKYLIDMWYDPDYWARPLKRAITNILLNKVAKLFLEDFFVKWTIYTVDYNTEGVFFEKK